MIYTCGYVATQQGQQRDPTISLKICFAIFPSQEVLSSYCLGQLVLETKNVPNIHTNNQTTNRFRTDGLLSRHADQIIRAREKMPARGNVRDANGDPLNTNQRP